MGSSSPTTAGRFTRVFAIALILASAVAIPLAVVGPVKPDTDGYDEALADALTDARLNELSATGAPQQQVVNGWLNRDLQLIQIKQNNDLLVLMHLGVSMGVAALIAAVIAGLATFKAPPPPAGEPAVAVAPPPVDHRPPPPAPGAWQSQLPRPPDPPPLPHQER